MKRILNAVESGHLVIASLHATNSEDALYRLCNSFPPDAQDMVRTQVSSVLSLLNLWSPLNKIVNDQQLKSAARQIEKKIGTFKQLRNALSLTISGNKKGLNDDGDDDQSFGYLSIS